MRQLIIFLATILLLCGCAKQDKEVDDFSYDENYLYRRIIYNYEFYSDGKIKSDHAIQFLYEGGVLADTLGERENQFVYNSKGNIERIFSLTDSSEQFKIYDNLDSLVADYTIVKRGIERDTFLINKFHFENGKKVRSTSLMFSQKKSSRDLDYDTLGSKSELVYDGEILSKAIVNYLSGETNEIYYLPTPKKDIYDEIWIGAKHDTARITRTVFKGNMRIVTYQKPPEPLSDSLYYDSGDRLIRKTFEDFSSTKKKYTYSFNYDKKGNLSEESLYIEAIGDAR